MKFILLYLFTSLSFSYGASCCGGGSSIPGLITGDFRAQMGLQATYQNEIGKAYSQGKYLYYNNNKKRTRQNYSLFASSMISERAQIGGKINFSQTDYSNDAKKETASQFGDSEISFGYELIQERSFSWWQPRGFVFIALTLPTGSSNYNSSSSLYSDVNGKEQWGISTGMSFVKIIRSYDFLSSFQVGYRFSDKQKDVSINESFYGSFLIGAGVSPYNSNFRLGVNISYFQESAKDVYFGEKKIETQKEFYSELSIVGSYAIDPNLSLSINYSDQSILGPAQNTTLSRSVGVLVHKRWSL